MSSHEFIHFIEEILLGVTIATQSCPDKSVSHGVMALFGSMSIQNAKFDLSFSPLTHIKVPSCTMSCSPINSQTVLWLCVLIFIDFFFKFTTRWQKLYNKSNIWENYRCTSIVFSLYWAEIFAYCVTRSNFTTKDKCNEECNDFLNQQLEPCRTLWSTFNRWHLDSQFYCFDAQ